jgi:hypothetical protein
MAKLTPVDIQKIQLYIPFNVMIQPMFQPSEFLKHRTRGFVDQMLITDFEDDCITASSDICVEANDDRPVLRSLEDMTTAEYKWFVKETHLHPSGKFKITEMIEEILSRCTPTIFFYCLTNHFDMFNLIKEGKAIHQTPKK